MKGYSHSAQSLVHLPGALLSSFWAYMCPRRVTRARHAAMHLLDLPDTFLLQLVSGQYLDSNSKLALFSSCRAVHDLVLQQSPCTRLTLCLCTTPLTQALSAVQLASLHSHSISVRLVSYWQGKVVLIDDPSTALWPFLEAGQRLALLTNVTELYLEDVKSDTLLPQAVADACPNLTTLTLQRCSVFWASTSTFTASLPKLQALRLSGSCLPSSGGDWWPQLSQQLANFTALQDLSIGLLFGSLTNIINPIASQLTHLAIYGMCFDEPALPRHLWPQLFHALTHLVLRHDRMCDADMVVLLSMPSLTHLDVAAFMLDNSFVGHPCKWQHVTVCELTVQSLAYLPLHSNLLLKVSSSFDLGASVMLLQEAQTNLASSRGLCGDFHEVVDFGQDGVDDAAQWWALRMPLLVGASSLCVASPRLTFPIMHIISMYALGRGPFALHIGYDCIWDAPTILPLVSAMPEGSELQLDCVSGEATIIQICCAVRRPLTLCLYCGSALADGHLERITAALQEYGQRHVTLEYGSGSGMFRLFTSA